MSPQETLRQGYNTVKDHALELGALSTMLVALAGVKATNANALSYLPPETVPDLCTEFPTAPCDSGVDPNSLDNEQVKWCQDSVVGVEGDKYNQGIIIEQDADYKTGSRKVEGTTTLGRFDMGTSLTYDFSCPRLTKNYVKQRVVLALPTKKDPNKFRYKSMSSSKTSYGSDDITFEQSSQAGAKPIVQNQHFMMSRKLTEEDLKKGQKVCIENTIFSEPKIQKPHFGGPQGAEGDVLGPMVTQHRKTHYCAKKSDILYAKSKKRSKASK